MIWLSFQIICSHAQTTAQEKTPTFQIGFLQQLVNVKMYFHIMTLLSVYLILNIKSLTGLLLAGTGIVCFGSLACLSWVILGLQLQGTYAKHFNVINLILSLFLVYFAETIYGVKECIKQNLKKILDTHLNKDLNSSVENGNHALFVC